MQNNRAIINKTLKILTKTESCFLKQLHYWMSRKHQYGILINEKIWIYNTLDQWADQLKFSKSSVRRAINSLKEKKIIECAYLSRNKRDRTLFYTIDYKKLNDFVATYTTVICANEHYTEHMNEHMNEHMYNINYQKQINKSNKSEQDFVVKTTTNNSKQNIVQDMLKVWKDEFPNAQFVVSKQLSRYLVAAFKKKFESCLKKWHRYLKILKTSAFITSEKFRLSIEWAIKFITIDKIKQGWLGTNETKIAVDSDEIIKQVVNHIALVNEPDECKRLRKKIVQIFSPSVYVGWFLNTEIKQETNLFYCKTESTFHRDYINNHFADKLCIEAIC